jgi:protein phosphatase
MLQVGDEHRGALVNCGRCAKPFMVAGVPPPVARPALTQKIVPPPPSMAAPPGTYDTAPQQSIKETVRDVFKAIMPFSKIDTSGPILIQPSVSPPPPQPAPPKKVEEEEDFGFDLTPAAAAALRMPAQRSPSIPIQVPAGAHWAAPTATGVCRLDTGGASSVGMVRKRNEDSFLIQQLSWANLDQRNEVVLAVVSDGLGGHEAGDRASHMTIQALGAGLSSILAGALSGQTKDNSPSTLAPAVETALKVANQQVFRRSQSDASCRGMGATVSMVLVWNGQVVIGHVGDTRVYVVRGGKASQLTRDQTFVEKMVQMGQLTPAQAAVHPARNEVAQAIGRQPDVEPAVSQFKMVRGDWLIIACDGLHAHVDLALMERITKDCPASATILAHKLVDMANERGGSDNCTVVAIHCY